MYLKIRARSMVLSGEGGYCDRSEGMPHQGDFQSRGYEHAKAFGNSYNHCCNMRGCVCVGGGGGIRSPKPLPHLRGARNCVCILLSRTIFLRASVILQAVFPHICTLFSVMRQRFCLLKLMDLLSRYDVSKSIAAMRVLSHFRQSSCTTCKEKRQCFVT